MLSYSTSIVKGIFICSVFVFACEQMSAQGCSDAGLCTIESFKPMPGMEEVADVNKLTFGLSTGAADYDIAVFGGALGYSRAFGEQWRIDSKITFLSQGGNDISVSGPGDVFLNLNFKPSQKIVLSAGVKIPLTKADKMNDGLSLPMDYQSSLGTFDFLGGISYSLANWQFALGFQIPLEQNENAFFSDEYASDSPLVEIQSTNMFQRQGDILLRISKSIEVNEKMTISPGLLPIYHLGEDEFTNRDGLIESIAGSDGLTLNGTVFLDYRLGKGNALEFSLGFPFIVRQVRPDGLTRSFVLGLGYAKKF